MIDTSIGPIGGDIDHRISPRPAHHRPFAVGLDDRIPATALLTEVTSARPMIGNGAVPRPHVAGRTGMEASNLNEGMRARVRGHRALVPTVVVTVMTWRRGREVLGVDGGTIDIHMDAVRLRIAMRTMTDPDARTLRARMVPIPSGRRPVSPGTMSRPSERGSSRPCSPTPHS